jgi:hypothetical protein
MGNALRGMADEPFLLSRNYQEQQWRAERKGAHPNILIFEKLFVRRMARQLKVPVFAHNMIRDLGYQQQLFDEGVSKAKPGKSPHQYGCAVDIVHGTKAWNLTKEQWLLMGHIGKELATHLGVDVVWGGDWKFYDPAHWELANWREVKKLMDDAEWGSDPKTAFEVAYATDDVCLRAREERWPRHIVPYHSVDWHEEAKRVP